MTDNGEYQLNDIARQWEDQGNGRQWRITYNGNNRQWWVSDNWELQTMGNDRQWGIRKITDQGVRQTMHNYIQWKLQTLGDDRQLGTMSIGK